MAGRLGSAARDPHHGGYLIETTGILRRRKRALVGCLLLLGCSETATQVGDAGADTMTQVGDVGGDTMTMADSTAVLVDVEDRPRVDTAPTGDGAVADTAPDTVLADGAGDVSVGDVPGGCTGGTLCPEGAGMLCVDVRTNPNHCGRCGVRCCTRMPCVDGRCQGIFGCSPGSTRCNCACVNTQTDSSNCGACGINCPAGRVCLAGSCADPTCLGGGATCLAGRCLCAGRCSDLQTDVANCGRCGVVCERGQACVRGACAALPLPDGGTSDVPGVSCGPVEEPPMPMGVCDGRGRIACQNWADTGLDGGTALVVCTLVPAGCAHADTCADLRDLASCRCGAGPACGPGQRCLMLPSGPACRCLRPR
jgi:hypothetical protein